MVCGRTRVGSIRVYILPPLFGMGMIVSSSASTAIAVASVGNTRSFTSIYVRAGQGRLSSMRFASGRELCVNQRITHYVTTSVTLFIKRNVIPCRYCSRRPAFSLFGFSSG